MRMKIVSRTKTKGGQTITESRGNGKSNRTVSWNDSGYKKTVSSNKPGVIKKKKI